MESGAGAVWLIAGTIAAFISASAAAAGAIVASVALRSQTRAVDVTSYLEILQRLQEFERRLKDAASDRDQQVFALREYANFLEAVAHLHNAGRFGRDTAALCRDALCTAIAALEISEEAMSVLGDSFTSRETFEHLVAFRKKHKSKIEERKASFQAMRMHNA
jgi:hypothetical protein